MGYPAPDDRPPLSEPAFFRSRDGGQSGSKRDRPKSVARVLPPLPAAEMRWPCGRGCDRSAVFWPAGLVGSCSWDECRSLLCEPLRILCQRLELFGRQTFAVLLECSGDKGKLAFLLRWWFAFGIPTH